MHQVVYINKLKHNCTLTLLDPRLLYVGTIQAYRYLYFKNNCPDSYNYLSVLCVLCLAPCSDAGYLSVLWSIRQLPICTTQCWAVSNAHYLASYIVYIIFVLFRGYIYQNYIVLRHI